MPNIRGLVCVYIHLIVIYCWKVVLHLCTTHMCTLVHICDVCCFLKAVFKILHTLHKHAYTVILPVFWKLLFIATHTAYTHVHTHTWKLFFESCFLNLHTPNTWYAFTQDPMTHHWTKPMSFRKKVFCNVCRKKIHSQGVLCEGRFVSCMIGEIICFFFLFFFFSCT